MLIRSKLSERDFIGASLILLYSKTSTKVITGIFALFFLIESSMMISARGNYFFALIIYPLIVMAISPAMTYFSAKRIYASNKMSGETIEYDFEDGTVTSKGETFSTQENWKNIYKVTQATNWVFIWRSRQLANPIPKRDISEQQLKELKDILNRNNVKNNL